MKIKSISAYKVDIPLSKPYTIAYKSIDAVKIVVFKVVTNNGTCGFGAAAPSPEVTGEKPSDSFRVLESEPLQQVLIGQDIFEFLRLVDDLDMLCTNHPAARTAIESALLDAIGKLLGKPVYRLLGQRVKPLPTSVTVGIKDIPDSLVEIQDYIRLDFRIIKVKLGKSVEEDVEKLHKIFEKFGNQIQLRVDINQGYSLSEFKWFLQRTNDIPLDVIEQPLPVSEFEYMELLDNRTINNIAADENLHSQADALKLATPKKRFGIYNIKMMKCGGPSKARRISDIAEFSGIRLMWGSNDESVISIASALHSALASKCTAFLDLDGYMDLSMDPATGGYEVKNGVMYPLEKPGYGLKVEL